MNERAHFKYVRAKYTPIERFRMLYPERTPKYYQRMGFIYEMFRSFLLPWMRDYDLAADVLGCTINEARSAGRRRESFLKYAIPLESNTFMDDFVRGQFAFHECFETGMVEK